MSWVVQAVAGEGYTAYAYMDDGSVRCMDFTEAVNSHPMLRRIKSPADFQKRVRNIDGSLTIDLTSGADPYFECDFSTCTTHTVMELVPTSDPLEPAKKVKYGNYVINHVSEVAYYWGEDEYMRYYHSARYENEYVEDDEADEVTMVFVGVTRDGKHMAEMFMPSMYLQTGLDDDDAAVERFRKYVAEHEVEIKNRVRNLKVTNEPPAMLWGDIVKNM